MGPTVLNTALFYCTVGPKLGLKLGLKLGPKLGHKILSIELPPLSVVEENSMDDRLGSVAVHVQG